MAEGHPWHPVTNSRGANQDVEPEILFAQEGTGIYLDSHNGRPVSVEGSSSAHERIKGEQRIYANTTSLVGYECIGSESVNGNIVEFWAKTGSAGICRVNGVIVINSVNFQIDPAFPLQIDKNENALSGEIFITDNNIPPFMFDVSDLISSLTSNPTKYFADFDPLLYQVNLQSPLDRIAFIELIDVGGGGGLPVGQYQYQMRYVTNEGDRTNWSPVTPLIPVMEALSSDSREYPWAKTYGGPPDPSSKTAFAPHLRFRVTNLYNYDYVEIKRISYNAGAGINFAPIGTKVAKISISPQEISVRDYIDPAESNENIPLSENDETQILVEIQKAKAVRYYNRRLNFENFTVASRDANPTVLQFADGSQGFPVMDFMGTAGHKDPWNHAYRRKYMAGERYGFAFNLYDGVGTKAFANQFDKLTNYQFPNRRDPASGETQNYSFGGTVAANDTTVFNVSNTHEVFDVNNRVNKNDACSFKNIVRSGKVLGLTGTRTINTSPPNLTDSGVNNSDCNEDTGVIQNHGAHVTGPLVSCSYQPFTPVKQNDGDVTGHNYVVNPRVYGGDSADCFGDQANAHTYRPAGMAPNYYSMGLMVAGISNLPSWAKSFSICRTRAARRVLAQGIGFYSLSQAQYNVIGNATLATKAQNKFWFYSPDVEQGILSSDQLNDIIANPQNYAIQCVSPLGFFSEVYSFENAADCNRDRIIDMITYARMIRDNGVINPGEDGNMGLPSGGFNYIAYDKYRNTGQNPNTFGADPDKGNRTFDLFAITRKTDGRGQYLELEINGSNIYGKGSTGGSTSRNFDDSGMKDFTEPFYIVNIIQKGAEIRDQDIQKYQATDVYIKLESIIGKGTGEPGNGSLQQKLLLVDERWEDCIPSPLPGQFGSATDRYLYVKKPNGQVEKWLNVTYYTPAARTTVEQDIINLGSYLGTIKGVYTHNNIGNTSRFYEIVFYHPTIVPQDGDFITVRYDNTAPIRVYGGDTFVGETIFAPIDRQADANASQAENQFAFGIGFPYFKWKLNPRYYQVKSMGATLNVIQDVERCKLGFLRQLCVMFCVESRAGIHYSYNSTYPNQFFPLINYVIRPNRWKDDKNILDNGGFQGYVDDYGSDEESQWKWGGFRFLQQINPDYSCESQLEFFSKPKHGYVERTWFPTGIISSLPRQVNIQDSPGLKTFAANSSFFISDNQGEIKRAWSATTEKGDNLYAITNKGICLLITNKAILSDLNSSEIAFAASDQFIQGEYWLTKDTGMYDEMWRAAIEGFVPMDEGGKEIRREALFFINNESVFCLSDNMVTDIARESGYYSKIFPAIKAIGSGFTTKITGGFNKLHQEYWIYIKGEVDNTFVYGQKNRMWHGTNDFKFDRFTTMFTRIFGHRNLETWELNQGDQINGATINYQLLTGASPQQMYEKEWIGVRINSLFKPSQVNFYTDKGSAIQATLTPAVPKQGAFYMKNYGGYEAFIPRRLAAVSPNRALLQSRMVLYEILYNQPGDFKVIDSAVQYKLIRLL